MNRVNLTVFLLILILVFIVYVIFAAQDVNIFTLIINFVSENTGVMFRESMHAGIAIGMVAIIIVALILFKVSSGS